MELAGALNSSLLSFGPFALRRGRPPSPRGAVAVEVEARMGQQVQSQQVSGTSCYYEDVLKGRNRSVTYRSK
eukprot:scaffold107166_cov33-Tisochrysis_lutea.AAC.1